MAAFQLTTPTLILSNCLSNVQPTPNCCEFLQEYQMSCQTASSFHIAGSFPLRKLTCQENTTQRVLCHCWERLSHWFQFCDDFTDNNLKYFFILMAVLLSHLSSLTENLDSCVCWLNSQSVSRPYSAWLPWAQAWWWGSKDREERGTFSCAAHTNVATQPLQTFPQAP